jgi:hypothetical protein
LAISPRAAIEQQEAVKEQSLITYGQTVLRLNMR